MHSSPPDDLRQSLIPALCVGLFADFVVVTLFGPEDQWEGPSLAELLGLSGFQVFLLVLGVGALTFLVTTITQWNLVVEDCRSRLLERACREAAKRTGF